MSDVDIRWSQPTPLTLQVERREENGNVLETTYEFPEPPDQKTIEKALEYARDKPIERLPGQGHRASRKVLPGKFGTWWFHHDWGPPLWRLPHPLLKIRRGRFEIGIGWIYHAVTFAWTWGERDG